MRAWVRRHPAFLVGLLTYALFLSVEWLGRAGYPGVGRALGPVLRVAIIPMYAVWLPFTILMVALTDPVGHPTALTRLVREVGLAAGLLPYLLVDLLLVRWRRGREIRPGPPPNKRSS